MSLSAVKKILGCCLFYIADRFPRSRLVLEPYGMRTKREWIGKRKSHIVARRGKGFELTSMSENYLSFQLFWKGAVYYEPLSQILLLELLRDRSLFLDVGANIGLYSLIACANNSKTRVIAFEAHPRVVGNLRENVAANLFPVTCEHLAVSDRPGFVTLHLSESDMSASLEEGFSHLQTHDVEVESTSLDKYFEKHGLAEPFVMKLDVEGHEDAAIRGGLSIISTYKPDIIMEVVQTYEDEHFSYLTDAGYQFYSVTDEGLRKLTRIEPTIRGEYLFENCLVSARSPSQIALISSTLVRNAQTLDLSKTTALVDADKIERIHSKHFEIH